MNPLLEVFQVLPHFETDQNRLLGYLLSPRFSAATPKAKSQIVRMLRVVDADTDVSEKNAILDCLEQLVSDGEDPHILEVSTGEEFQIEVVGDDYTGYTIRSYDAASRLPIGPSVYGTDDTVQYSLILDLPLAGGKTYKVHTVLNDDIDTLKVLKESFLVVDGNINYPVSPMVALVDSDGVSFVDSYGSAVVGYETPQS